MDKLRRGLWVVGLPGRVALVGMVRLYRVSLGALTGGQCRFHPSCSEYAILAIRRTGAIRGTAFSAWRILRCSPLSAGGVDHPPMGRRREYDGVIPPSRAPDGAVV